MYLFIYFMKYLQNKLQIVSYKTVYLKKKKTSKISFLRAPNKNKKAQIKLNSSKYRILLTISFLLNNAINRLVVINNLKTYFRFFESPSLKMYRKQIIIQPI